MTDEDPHEALDRFDRAAKRALLGPGRQSLYLGPWWNLALRLTDAGAQGWKRAVLERRPGRGADHWGHLYLVVTSTPGRVQLRPDDLGGARSAGASPAEPTYRALDSGPTRTWLVARGSSEMHSARLEDLAEAIALEYARDSSGPPG
jgi:hypothetical protein